MKQLFNSIKIIAVALVIGLGVSYVSAAPWSAPGTGATGGNTVASVNISEYDQTKIGSFTTDNFFKAGGAFNATGVSWNKPGYAVAEKAFISPWSFFTSAFLPGSGSQVKIGGGDDATTDIFNTAVTPFTIDLAGRGSGNNSVSGRQVIDIRTDTIACYPNATIRTNTPAVRLLNSKTGDDADAIVRGVQLSGGNPEPGKILVSVDRDGNAVWATPVYNSSTGKITFTYGPSPVASDQNICGTVQQPVDVCPNIAGDQATVPVGMITDTSGNCVTPPPVVDLCTNINGNQDVVPVGYTKDTPGLTPGVCTQTPVDLCSNIPGNQATIPTNYEAEPSTGKCFTWLDYQASAVKGNVGETCASFISRMTPGQPYNPVANGKFRVRENSQNNGITGPIIATYPDKCIYGKTTSNNNNNYGVAVLGDLFTVPTANSNSSSYNYYFYPMVWVNGGTPWHVYRLQYKSY